MILICYMHVNQWTFLAFFRNLSYAALKYSVDFLMTWNDIFWPIPPHLNDDIVYLRLTLFDIFWPFMTFIIQDKWSKMCWPKMIFFDIFWHFLMCAIFLNRTKYEWWEMIFFDLFSPLRNLSKICNVNWYNLTEKRITLTLLRVGNGLAHECSYLI